MEHRQKTAKVQRCQEILGYHFHDQDLCWEGLQMAGNGVVKAGARAIHSGNKRLSIVGVFVLELILSEQWYGGSTVEGNWSARQQKILSTANLNELGRDNEIDQCIQLGNGQQVISTKMMAGTMQSLMGAVYLDGMDNGDGIAAVKAVMQRLEIKYEE